MKTKEYSSLGLKVPFEVPETVEEFDTNAKRVGACLDEAINNVIYRGSLAEFRDEFCSKLEAQTSIERNTEPVMKDGKPVVKDGAEVTRYSETEGDYVKRVCATKNVEADSFQTLANEVANATKFDASAAERKPSAPKKLAELYKNSALACFKNKEANWPRLESMLAGEGIAMPTLTGDEAKDVELVGWAIKAAKDSQAKKSLEQFEA